MRTRLCSSSPNSLWTLAGTHACSCFLSFGMRLRNVQDCPFQNRTPAFNVKLCGPGKSSLIRVCDCLPAYADSKQQAQIRRWSIAFEPNLHCHVLMFKTRTCQYATTQHPSTRHRLPTQLPTNLIIKMSIFFPWLPGLGSWVLL